MSRAPLVLIVSEHEWASRSLDSILAPRGYAIVRAYNGEQALDRAPRHQPDAIFVERNLPDTSGLDLCRRIRDEGQVSPATALIITTSGPITHDQRLEALQAGAWELIALPMDAEELLLRLDRYTRAKLEADRVGEHGGTDPETGLYNHLGILQRAYELLAAGQRYGRALACVVFEPEAVTDVGMREFLNGTVRILRQATRRSDVVGRIGQNRFVIVAPETPPQGADVIADRLRHFATSDGGYQARVGVYGVPDVRGAELDADELVLRAVRNSRGPGSPKWN